MLPIRDREKADCLLWGISMSRKKRITTEKRIRLCKINIHHSRCPSVLQRYKTEGQNISTVCDEVYF